MVQAGTILREVQEGLKLASLQIFSDDPDESSISLELSGVGTDAEITVTPTTLSFGAVGVDDASAARSVTP